MDKQALDFLRQPPKGVIDFSSLIHDSYYYVDKTPSIKKVFGEDPSEVLLMARPRRFGKTLLMNTFYNFLKIDPENPDDTSYQDRLFQNTRIYEDKAFCERFMGKWPVIFVSFKEVNGSYFRQAASMLAQFIVKAASQHKYLLKSDRLDEYDKDQFKTLLKKETLMADPELSDLAMSLNILSTLLSQHYDKKVIVLIDEYDVPLAKAYSNGYYDDMVVLIQAILSSVLKDNTVLKKGVLTGCLRVSKKSIFTGLNNPDVNTVVNDEGFLADSFGFTKDEVKTMLDYYDLNAHEKAVQDWYDGYRIGGKEIFCPWDVVCFCKQSLISMRLGNKVSAPKDFWTATSSNFIIQEFMSYLKEKDADDMQTLLDGGEIEFSVNEDLSYREIESNHEVDDFWTMLLYTGYLTAVKTIRDDIVRCTVRIPNREIRSAFSKYIASYYKSAAVTKVSSELVAALLSGDSENVRTLIESKLRNFVSLKDVHTKSAPENFYHGFLDGIFSTQTSEFTDFRSNCDAGDGYADIVFSSLDHKYGVVIELKSARNEDSFTGLAADALKQIEERKYTDVLVKLKVKKIYCYGLSFYNKQCFVQCELKEL